MERRVQKVTPGIKVAKMIRKAEKQDLLIPVELACQLWPHHAAEGVPRKLEHNDIRWITPAEIPQYDFCPADVEILDKIMELKA
jgi:hypothetical protein